MSPRLVVLASSLVLAACEGGPGTLVVQVRTDLAPVVDFASATVRVTPLSGGETRTASLAAPAARDWGAGVRVAELALAPGDHRVEVALADADANLVVGRPARVTVERGVTVVTVLLTRDCGTVVCPAPGGDASATVCVAGRCAAEDCYEEHPERCGASDCADAAACPRPAAACARAACSASGRCFDEPDHAMCADAEVCAVASGCLPAADPGGAITQTLTLDDDADDGEITDGSVWFVDGEEADTVFMGWWSSSPSWGFFRFQLVTPIPAGSVVESAELSLFGVLTVDSGWEPTMHRLAVHTEDVPDSPRVAAPADVPGEARAAAPEVVEWPAASGLAWTVDGWNVSPDLSALVQGLVDRHGGLAMGASVQLWVRSAWDFGSNDEVQCADRGHATGPAATLRIRHLPP